MILLIAVSALTVWGILKAVSKCASKSAEKIRQESIQAQEAARAEQARLRLEWQQRQAEARLETQRLIAVEREQMRQAKEQERISKEQERQAEVLRKHEEQIAKLEFQVAQAEQNIEYYNERLANLMARRDNYMAQQTFCTPASKEWDKWQGKIISIDNQIHTADRQLNNAVFAKKQAEQRLSA